MYSNELTQRQMEFISILASWMKEKKQPMPRREMLMVFGIGVDYVALALYFKGIVSVYKKNGRVFYSLRKGFENRCNGFDFGR